LYSFPSAGDRLSTTLSYLMPQVPSPSTEPRPSSSFVRGPQSGLPNKKMAASVTLRPLYYPKAIQEQQTQRQATTGCGILQARNLSLGGQWVSRGLSPREPAC